MTLYFVDSDFACIEYPENLQRAINQMDLLMGSSLYQEVFDAFSDDYPAIPLTYACVRKVAWIAELTGHCPFFDWIILQPPDLPLYYILKGQYDIAQLCQHYCMYWNPLGNIQFLYLAESPPVFSSGRSRKDVRGERPKVYQEDCACDPDFPIGNLKEIVAYYSMLIGLEDWAEIKRCFSVDQRKMGKIRSEQGRGKDEEMALLFFSALDKWFSARDSKDHAKREELCAEAMACLFEYDNLNLFDSRRSYRLIGHHIKAELLSFRMRLDLGIDTEVCRVYLNYFLPEIQNHRKTREKALKIGTNFCRIDESNLMSKEEVQELEMRVFRYLQRGRLSLLWK